MKYIHLELSYLIEQFELTMVQCRLNTNGHNCVVFMGVFFF